MCKLWCDGRVRDSKADFPDHYCIKRRGQKMSHIQTSLVMLMLNTTCCFSAFCISNKIRYYTTTSFRILHAQKDNLYLFTFSKFGYFSLLILLTVKSESHGTLPKSILHLNPFRCMFYLNRTPEVFWCAFFTQIIVIWIPCMPVQTCLEVREYKDGAKQRLYTWGLIQI